MTTNKSAVARITHNAALAVAANQTSDGDVALVAVRDWLLQQLSAQVYAKLGQGGHTQNQIPLRQVFIDLPVTDRPNAGLHETGRSPFLRRLLASEPLNLTEVLYPRENVAVTSGALELSDTDESAEPSPRPPVMTPAVSRNSATLLIGGPGQGKSTLGQLACQLHRAALLMPFMADLTGSQRELVGSFANTPSQSESDEIEQLEIPSKALFPLQVSLPDLADWLSSNEVGTGLESGAEPAIIRFIASQPGAREVGLSAEMLWHFAATIPVLIVLDGFDEIGATQDRARLVAAGSELLICLRDRKACAQILATTRPQGYAGELGNLGIKLLPRYLTPLSKDEALEYAGKLVNSKIVDADLRQKTLVRLREAANEPATQRLLTTPLQVTILAALVQQLGRAPRERWNLFRRYFSYTYDREIERGTYASRLLADYRSHIEKIHARVGLLLQVEAERDGGASARMSRKVLEEVIREVLSEDEVSEDELADLVKDIAVAAEQRLVFLVEPEPNRFGFEIRSLQEFMAAWALTSGRDAEVESRLIQVAKAPMFRNVVLFIASRLFSEGSPLRDVLASEVCGSLDDDMNDLPSHITKVGAVLALETLEEGAVLAQPKRARALMQRAVRLLELPPNNEHPRLALITNADTLPVMQQAIDENAGASSKNAAYDLVSACVCLILLVNRGEKWAQSKLVEIWFQLKQPTLVVRACADLDVPLSEEVSAIAELVLPEVPYACATTISFVSPPSSGPGSLLPWIVGALDPQPWETGGGWHVSTREGHPPAGRQIPTLVKAELLQRWSVSIAVAKFQYEPGAHSLAAALDAIADAERLDDFRQTAWAMYWPLSTCLLAASGSADLRCFASMLRRDNLGDSRDWIAAELAWSRKAFRWTDSMSEVLGGVPWDKASIRYTPPFWTPNVWRFLVNFSSKTPSNRILHVIHQVNSAFETCQFKEAKAILAYAALHLLRNLSSKIDISTFPVEAWFSNAGISLSYFAVRPRCVSVDRWEKILKEICFTPAREGFFERTHVLSILANNEIGNSLIRTIVSCLARHTGVGSRGHNDVRLRGAAVNSLRKIRPTTVVGYADLAILKVYVGDVGDHEVDRVFNDIAVAGDTDPAYWDALVAALNASGASGQCENDLASRVFQVVKGSYPRGSAIIDALRDREQSKKSGLELSSNWNSLGLPLPLPSASLVAKVAELLPDRPISIAAVKLRDVRGIRDLQLEFARPEDEGGQWIVVLGPNGIGKTTLLRSIALALRDSKNPAIWPKGTFSSNWNRSEDSTEPRLNESRIDLRLGDGATIECLIRNTHSFSIQQSPQLSRASLFPVFAYGCRRGSALGGAAREVNLGLDDGPEIATLFDDSANLIHAETWIIQLEGEAQRTDSGRLVYSSVIDALRHLLDVDSIAVFDKRVWVKENGGPTLPFSALSDGYLTSAGWFVDLVARWIDLLEKMEVEVNGNFLADMKGLVLLDEIDLHLHPRWQVDIISRTRRLLPKMSFIVTTHNPLTLVGAKAEEIWILSSKGGAVSCQQGLETPMLLTGGQLYRRYFGIEDVFPGDLGKSLRRYGFLCGYADRSEAEEKELGELAAVLQTAGILPQWDVVERRSLGENYS